MNIFPKLPYPIPNYVTANYVCRTMCPPLNAAQGHYGHDWASELSSGTLLIADPFLTDPLFERSVVLLLHAETSEGAMGLVLNRASEVGPPQGREVIGEFLERLTRNQLKYGDTHRGTTQDLPLCRSGGPVDTNDWFMLRLSQVGDINQSPEITFMEVPEYSTLHGIMPDLPDLDAVEWANHIVHDKIIFFAGYTGWAVGQLESELDTGSWIIYRGGPNWFSHVHKPNLWDILLKSMGGHYSLMPSYPRHPLLN